jgi:hypothetical protein
VVTHHSRLRNGNGLSHHEEISGEADERDSSLTLRITIWDGSFRTLDRVAGNKRSLDKLGMTKSRSKRCPMKS